MSVHEITITGICGPAGQQLAKLFARRRRTEIERVFISLDPSEVPVYFRSTLHDHWAHHSGIVDAIQSFVKPTFLKNDQMFSVCVVHRDELIEGRRRIPRRVWYRARIAAELIHHCLNEREYGWLPSRSCLIVVRGITVSPLDEDYKMGKLPAMRWK